MINAEDNILNGSHHNNSIHNQNQKANPRFQKFKQRGGKNHTPSQQNSKTMLLRASTCQKKNC